jgi:hypothetical protein
MNARSCGFGRGSFSFLALVEAGFLVGAMMKDESVNETNVQSKKRKTCRLYEIYWCSIICTINHVRQSEMQDYNEDLTRQRT